ncbi:amino acid permease [Novosphingobium olei]|uniref:amino acid permease n=1 Tax=Novosphingobium olei TaxID=2728851 RepID=UPI003089ED76|nr:amino acid permease [Novosphingobium olei]
MSTTGTRPARQLGFLMTLALVVGNLIGSGIYLLPATLAPLGANQLLGWMVTIGGALCLAIVFARLGGKLPLAGGPYAYANAAFGPLAGFATAWSYWTMIWAGNGAIAVAVVSNISLIAPVIGRTPGLPALLAVGCVWLLTAVNIRGVRTAGEVSLVTSALKLIPLVALIALALWLALTGAPHVTQPPVPIAAGAIASAAGLTFWGFLGLESATVPADKVENASAVVPRATLIGTVLTGVVYVGISLAFFAYMPTGQAAASPAPVADFLGQHFGSGVASVVAVFAAISAFGTLNGFILLQGEVPWAMARGGVFPAWFAKETSRGTPGRAHVVSSVLLTCVAVMNYSKGLGDLFQFIASVSLAAGMLSYLMVMIAALKLLPGERLLAVVALIAAAFIVWASWGLGAHALGYGALFVVAGVPVYWVVRRGQKKDGPSTSSEQAV